ncbi:MAG: SH3 domain-containing protein [Kiritimatiellia bacterium]|nr:SH3 domain-containing protein [Kiritimatiellia bacterium]MDP6848539.1 SH3 domain-containing protein [Kiritimatiellia bacterium]
MSVLTYPRSAFLTVQASFLIALGATVVHVHGATAVKVVTNGAELRSAPNARSHVVSSVNRGDSLSAIELPATGWAKIVAPGYVHLWVYGDLVRKGVVIVPTVLVRAGPGISYEPVGDLKRGDTVSLKGAHEDWLKIKPPRGSFLWIERRYLVEAKSFSTPEPPPPEVKPVSPDPPAQPVVRKAPEEPVKAPVERIEERPLVESRVVLQVEPSSGRREAVITPSRLPKTGQPVSPTPGTRETAETPSGRTIPETGYILPPSAKALGLATRKGLLKPVGLLSLRSPSRYILVEKDSYGRTTILCYVLGNRSDLSRLKGRRITVYGREYSMRSIRHPAILPEKITVDQ